MYCIDSNYNTDYNHLMIKTEKNNVGLQLYMIEIIIIDQPVTVQKRLNNRESSVGKLSVVSLLVDRIGLTNFSFGQRRNMHTTSKVTTIYIY